MAYERTMILKNVRFTSIKRILFINIVFILYILLITQNTQKWAPKCSREASGATLTDPGRAQEPSQERQKKNEIGPRGVQDAPRREIWCPGIVLEWFQDDIKMFL